MKGLALETIIKMIILVVVALLVINLMIFFSEEIKNYIRNFFGKGEFKTEIVENPSYSTSQVMTYMRSCWDRTGEKFHEDVVCYILKGDVSGVDPSLLLNAVEPPATVNNSKFDPLKTTTIIRFEDVGNVIHVES